MSAWFQYGRSQSWAALMLVFKYVDENGSVAMLAAKRSAGVAPEVNISDHTSCMSLPSVNKVAHSSFETRGDVTRSPKQGYQWPHKRTGVINNF